MLDSQVSRSKLFQPLGFHLGSVSEILGFLPLPVHLLYQATERGGKHDLRAGGKVPNWAPRPRHNWRSLPGEAAGVRGGELASQLLGGSQTRVQVWALPHSGCMGQTTSLNLSCSSIKWGKSNPTACVCVGGGGVAVCSLTQVRTQTPGSMLTQPGARMPRSPGGRETGGPQTAPG